MIGRPSPTTVSTVGDTVADAAPLENEKALPEALESAASARSNPFAPTVSEEAPTAPAVAPSTRARIAALVVVATCAKGFVSVSAMSRPTFTDPPVAFTAFVAVAVTVTAAAGEAIVAPELRPARVTALPSTSA